MEQIKKIMKRVKHVLSLFTIAFALTLSLAGCTQKESSGDNEEPGAVLDEQGELEIEIDEDEATFGE